MSAAFKKDLKLYIDESGIPDPDSSDRYYTLCGICVNSYQANTLKIKADQIKFKFWGHTKVVFHSREIGLKNNVFSILQDPRTEGSFLADIFNYLNTNGYKIILISVDKQAAKAAGWSAKKIEDNTTDMMIETFLRILKSKSDMHGQIILESSGAKDIRFYKRYTSYLSQGFPKQNLSHIDVKNLVTSVSFVSKKNHDIETQIADIYAYPANRRCAHDDNHQEMISGSYEHKICQLLPAKLAQMDGTPCHYRLPLT
ncbi:MAG: DUF3800 domain-containing protein [Minisyncoccia bacterium]